MKNISLSHFYSIIFFFALFTAPLPLLGTIENNVTSHNMDNQNTLYINLDKNISNIAQVIFEISTVDNNANSPIHLLRKHLENGFVLALKDEVIQVLEYANWLLERQKNNSSNQQLLTKFYHVVEQVLDGKLDINEE